MNDVELPNEMVSGAQGFDDVLGRGLWSLYIDSGSGAGQAWAGLHLCRGQPAVLAGHAQQPAG